MASNKENAPRQKPGALGKDHDQSDERGSSTRDGTRHPRISRFAGEIALGKRVELDIIDDERVLIKTPLAQSVRHVEALTVPTAEAMAEVVRTCQTDQALALGVCGREQARIVVADRLRLKPELKAKGVVARTKYNPATGEGHFRFSDGPGWVLLDADAGDPAMAKRLHALGGAWPVLTSACPSLASAARIRRLSQSARLIVEGEPRFANLSCHVYMLLERQTDAPTFLTRLHQRLWLVGFGHVEVTAAGVVLEKSLVDVSVASPERLIFEGPPILGEWLDVDADLDRTEWREGVALALMPALNDEGEARYRQLVDASMAAVRGEAKTKSIAHAEAHGCSPRVAAAFARGIAKREVILPATWPLIFRNIGMVTVRAALLDPDRFCGCDLLDPLDPKPGRWQARLLRGRQDGTLFVKSFAHGGQDCQFEYDLETATKALTTCRVAQRETTYLAVLRKMNLRPETWTHIRREL